MAGRPQLVTKTGAGFKLAEFLNANWDRVGKTNEETAEYFGYNSPNVASLWRTGRSRVPIERLPDLAKLMKIDLAELLPLWIEQFVGKRTPEVYAAIQETFKHLVSPHEFPIIKAVRTALKNKPTAFTKEQLEAFGVIAKRGDLAAQVIELGKTEKPVIVEAPVAAPAAEPSKKKAKSAA